jgi:hypothetical protein
VGCVPHSRSFLAGRTWTLGCRTHLTQQRLPYEDRREPLSLCERKRSWNSAPVVSASGGGCERVTLRTAYSFYARDFLEITRYHCARKKLKDENSFGNLGHWTCLEMTPELQAPMYPMYQ